MKKDSRSIDATPLSEPSNFMKVLDSALSYFSEGSESISEQMSKIKKISVVKNLAAQNPGIATTLPTAASNHSGTTNSNKEIEYVNRQDYEELCDSHDKLQQQYHSLRIQYNELSRNHKGIIHSYNQIASFLDNVEKVS